jgi:hypothetical protein
MPFYAHSYSLMASQRRAKSFVVYQGNDRDRQLQQISQQNIRSIMNSVSGPVKAFSVPLWAVKHTLEFLNVKG